LLGNGSVNTFPRQRIRKKQLLETVFSVGSSPRLYNEDSRPAEGIFEKIRSYSPVPELIVVSWDNKSSARAAVTRGPEHGNLKDLQC
jgi:hypothetical protein